jgi:hypothetical protein
MTLSEYPQGRLGGDERKRIAEHVAGCPRCREELAVLAEFLKRTSAPEPARSGVLERVKILIAEWVGGGPGSQATAPAGVRGEAEGTFVFEAGETQIALRSRPADDRTGRVSILGLITGQAGDGWEVHLWRDGKPAGNVAVDDLGNFSIDAIPPGRYDLIVAGGGVEIHIQEVPIEKS